MEYDLQEDFRTLINNGWLTKEEANLFITNPDIIDSMNNCTSPQKENIFKALKLVPLNKIKVLILGKDPYPNPKDAHGLAFSSLNPTTPDSLKNIFKALDSVYKSNLFENANNNLTNWAKEGVLLLNTGLTFQKIVDDSLDKKSKDILQAKTQKEHMKIWRPFVQLIIQKILNIKDRPIVMLLWGNDAHDIVFQNITDKDFKNKCHVRNPIIIPNSKIMLLQTSHPSPLSVNRGGDFLTTAPTHFIECDKHLGKNKIHWINI